MHARGLWVMRGGEREEEAGCWDVGGVGKRLVWSEGEDVRRLARGRTERAALAGGERDRKRENAKNSALRR